MPLRATAVVLLAVLACLGTTPSASADQVRRDDPRGDLWQPSGYPGWERAPATRNADLVETLVRHDRGRIVIRVAYARLVPDRDDEVSVEARLRTPGGTWLLSIDASNADGYVRLFARSGREVDCRVRAVVSYRNDVVRATVPRRCLYRPAWVRVSLAARRYDERTGLSWDNGWSARRPSRHGTWTPRVRRG